MALPTSGEISLGDIRAEWDTTGQITLNDASLYDMWDPTTTFNEVGLSDFYGEERVFRYSETLSSGATAIGFMDQYLIDRGHNGVDPISVIITIPSNGYVVRPSGYGVAIDVSNIPDSSSSPHRSSIEFRMYGGIIGWGGSGGSANSSAAYSGNVGHEGVYLDDSGVDITLDFDPFNSGSYNSSYGIFGGGGGGGGARARAYYTQFTKEGDVSFYKSAHCGGGGGAGYPSRQGGSASGANSSDTYYANRAGSSGSLLSGGNGGYAQDTDGSPNLTVNAGEGGNSGTNGGSGSTYISDETGLDYNQSSNGGLRGYAWYIRTGNIFLRNYISSRVRGRTTGGTTQV